MSALSGTIPLDSSKGLLADVVGIISTPAAVVLNGEDVLVRNQDWVNLIAGSGDSRTPSRLDHELRGFTLTGDLYESLRRGTSSAGLVHISRVPDRSSLTEAPRHLELRWHRLGSGPDLPSFALLVIKADDSDLDAARIMSAQRKQIDRLLIHQTLIEEAERRRIGQSLHDVVSQNLALLRSAVLESELSKAETEPLVDRIDTVIGSVRTLGFELSPPVLADLGLCPALEWLAEHLNTEYDADIEVEGDSNEPRLSHESRTIVFRAVRELARNAVKHTKGAKIVIRCDSDEHGTRISVSDTGPGFDMPLGHSSSRFAHSYGLLSVEQQIRGIGGLFSLVSSVRDGTKALITIDAEEEKGD